ncbi:hypothetical protein LRS74_30390 [Streptomyces sp. LX-29]|uniref:hypothetical protein n=1 Tax=Streptomyces sp. LX-29 TaxID=2900152 RepID=UPI00240CEA96|nr:hypothetical protein [Streptomyces sp. LX-29]WFB10878.1 hypothetical protein LRS74_30390 [Streptomyces sp. LX-29]
MNDSEFRPVYHPAGHDHGLRIAIEDLRTGRWMSMRELLTQTVDLGLWTQRTQVLATAAAGTNVVAAWRAEEPESVAVLVMHARVTVERAVRARREGHRRTRELWQEAWEACQVAAHNAPDDPVPWVCLLALAQLDGRQRLPEHRLAPPEPMLFPGPWGLLREAHRRDPFNREAYHRMLQFVYARRTGGPLAEAVNFGQWVTSCAPRGSALHALPLYVHVERYREEHRPRRALDLHWTTDEAVRDARLALRNWFDAADPASRSLLDLSHLAHALWGALRFADAARVFAALGPYYTPPPWNCRAADRDHPDAAEEVFLRARARAFAASPEAGSGPRG